MMDISATLRLNRIAKKRYRASTRATIPQTGGERQERTREITEAQLLHETGHPC